MGDDETKVFKMSSLQKDVNEFHNSVDALVKTLVEKYDFQVLAFTNDGTVNGVAYKHGVAFIPHAKSFDLDVV